MDGSRFFKAICVCIGIILVWSAAMPVKNKLSEYNKKRNFTRTTEPEGKLSSEKEGLFVIQKHAASHLHYDFRLAVGGVLISWAVPKGPSLNPATKRLAIMTEDHPLAYADFEGEIPEGEYGAGTVMVWDTGTYRNIKEKNGAPVSMKQCLKDGRIEIFLTGKKLRGGFALVRTESMHGNWLLIKMRDKYAQATGSITTQKPNSVLTGRSMAAIKKDSAPKKVSKKLTHRYDA
jgi:DNA ligase D-like protein (predicted 3'-phosphoesterase)